MIVQTRSPQFKRELADFIMEVVLVFIGTAGMIAIGMYGLFDRTLLQIILVCTLIAAGFTVAIWGVVREYL